MKNGYLSQYFETVAVKKLSAVEVNPESSHQHEFNGSKELKTVLRTIEKTQFQTKFLWIEEQNEAIAIEGNVTWYDAREKHPTRSEYRLYFSSNPVIELARPGDTMFIARRTDNTLLIILTPSGSTIEQQLHWLFGLQIPTEDTFLLSEIQKQKDHELDFASRFILDEIGVEIEEPENEKLDLLLSKFSTGFPSTLEFSRFARATIGTSLEILEDPDHALLAFMEWEEKLFRRLERRIVSNRLKEGFESGSEQDIDGFISFSLSVQNRRKSRVGYAFEDHLSYIFKSHDLLFSSRPETENKAKPDFVFPGIKYYLNTSFPNELLTILAAKTSCKDRWRQVLSEAKRIPEKYLLTVEPGISENQTNEMRSNDVHLVLPSKLHETYLKPQQDWLLNVKDFIDIVSKKQRSSKGLGYFGLFQKY